MARVTIGIPVYNGEKTISAAIESVLNQTFEDFLVLISDNASTDDTASICSRFSASDSRVIYYRQTHNIGPSLNFQFLLDSSKTDLFSWWAADDLRSPGFLDSCVNHLDLHPDCIASTALSVFGNERPTQFELKKALLMQAPSNSMSSAESRVVSFADICWNSHSTFFSVFRKSRLPCSSRMGGEIYAAKDWAWNLSLLSSGPIHFSDQEFIFLGTDGLSNSRDPWTLFRTRKINWILPFYQFTLAALDLSRGFSFANKFKIYAWLFSVNIFGFKQQALTVLRSTLNVKRNRSFI